MAAERNGTERSIPAMLILSDASEGSILLAAGRISTSSKVNPSLMILTPMSNYTHLLGFSKSALGIFESLLRCERRASYAAIAPCHKYFLAEIECAISIIHIEEYLIPVARCCPAKEVNCYVRMRARLKAARAESPSTIITYRHPPRFGKFDRRYGD